MSSVEYEKINHVIIVKTHGRRCIKSAFEKLRYGEHTPNSFSALTLKHKNPSATIIMFSTGNITIMGPKTLWGAMYVLEVLKQKFDLKVIHINVTNVVVKFTASKSSMNIKDLYNWNKRDCDCDVDLFPSCTYMVPNTKIKANFFNSGKVVLAGCNTEEKVHDVIKHLTYVIHSFYNDRTAIQFGDAPGNKKKLLILPPSMTNTHDEEPNRTEQTPNGRQV